MNEFLDELAAELTRDAPVKVGTMFRNPGIRIGKKIVAFLGHNDRLILKLPEARAKQLVAHGVAETVTMGTRTMREWVAIQVTDDPESTRDVWLPLTREALAYVRAGSDD